MSKLDLPQWAKRPMFKTAVNTNQSAIGVNNGAVNTTRKGDRHKAGYMAEYMRKRRAK
jgi:hypothetical protein